MAIVRAIVAGERDPGQLATLRHGRCKHSETAFVEFLTGHWRDEHLHTLASALQLYEATQGQIASTTTRLQAEVRALQPEDRRDTPVPPHPNPTKEKALLRRGDQEMRTELYRWAGVELTRIDGISAGAAEVILTEVGLDLSAFPSEKHFASWLRLAPRTAVSGGRPLRHKKTAGTGSTRVAGVLRMAALSLQRSRTALGAAFRRIARYKGGAVAIFAIARKLAVLVYRMLRYGQDYVDLGAAQYEARFRQRRLDGLRHTAQTLGDTLIPTTDAA